MELLIASQEKDIESNKVNIETGNKALEQASSARNTDIGELRRLKRESLANKEEIGILKNKIVAEKTEIERCIQALEDYRTSYRTYVRAKAKGEIIEALETLSGVVYKNVSIREVTAIGIQIRHDDGQKRIPYEDLPEAMQTRFQFDKKEKAKALALETAAKHEQEASITVAEGHSSEQAAKDNLKENTPKRKKINQDIFAKKSVLSQLLNDIKSLENERSRAFSGPGPKHYANEGAVNGLIQSKRDKAAVLQAEISQLQSEL